MSLDPLHNVAMEQAFLGVLLFDNTVAEHVEEFLRAEHFATPLHSKIYQTAIQIIGSGKVADAMSVRSYLQNEPMMQEAGGNSYLAELAGAIVSVPGAADYARHIHDLALRRDLVRIGDQIVQKARVLEVDETALHHIENAEKELYDLATVGTSQKGAQSFQAVMTQALRIAENAYQKQTQVVGVTTGFSDLDRMLGGLHASDLIILAGRPSMGKTALATNIAFNAAKKWAETQKDGASVAFFSLEMSAEQLATRILSCEAGIPSDRMRRGAIMGDEFTKLMATSREISSIQMFIDDTPALTIAGLRNRARRLKRQHQIGMIVVDYLQLLDGSGKGGRGESARVQEISEISRGLKAIAKELDLPVVALSQLSRAVEQRDDKRPQLSDLRESGSIEQDADVVLFVYREEYYEARKEPPEGSEKHREWQAKMENIRNKAEVIIAKQRHGPIGFQKLQFDGTFTKFSNLATSSVSGYL